MASHFFRKMAFLGEMAIEFPIVKPSTHPCHTDIIPVSQRSHAPGHKGTSHIIHCADKLVRYFVCTAVIYVVSRKSCTIHIAPLAIRSTDFYPSGTCTRIVRMAKPYSGSMHEVHRIFPGFAHGTHICVWSAQGLHSVAFLSF